mmetsp:Transcript_60527/g.160920  ORF Transcript_60527/g.160920 Transcript_60527/m.160920 type:complete len:310 (-) Transcript_60527:653-1582(-)
MWSGGIPHSHRSDNLSSSRSVQEHAEEFRRGGRLELWHHVSREADGREMEGRRSSRHRILSDVACRSRCIRHDPRCPSLGLLKDAPTLQLADPLLISVVGHARVSIAVIDEDVELLHKLRVQRHGSGTREIVGHVPCARHHRVQVQCLTHVSLGNPSSSVAQAVPLISPVQLDERLPSGRGIVHASAQEGGEPPTIFPDALQHPGRCGAIVVDVVYVHGPDLPVHLVQEGFTGIAQRCVSRNFVALTGVKLAGKVALHLDLNVKLGRVQTLPEEQVHVNFVLAGTVAGHARLVSPPTGVAECETFELEV